MANFSFQQVGVLVKQNKTPIVLTKRGEKLMLVTFFVSIVLLISFAPDLAELLHK